MTKLNSSFMIGNVEIPQKAFMSVLKLDEE